jgi:hypothetical protein
MKDRPLLLLTVGEGLTSDTRDAAHAVSVAKPIDPDRRRVPS